MHAGKFPGGCGDADIVGCPVATTATLGLLWVDTSIRKLIHQKKPLECCDLRKDLLVRFSPAKHTTELEAVSEIHTL